MDPERTDRHRGHQGHPDPAERPVRQRSLGRCELDDTEREGGHRGKGMKRDARGGVEERRKAHWRLMGGCPLWRPARLQDRSAMLGPLTQMLIQLTSDRVKAVTRAKARSRKRNPAGTRCSIVAKIEVPSERNVVVHVAAA